MSRATGLLAFMMQHWEASEQAGALPQAANSQPKLRKLPGYSGDWLY
jgi:hypothetical protein